MRVLHVTDEDLAVVSAVLRDARLHSQNRALHSEAVAARLQLQEVEPEEHLAEWHRGQAAWHRNRVDVLNRLVRELNVEVDSE